MKCWLCGKREGKRRYNKTGDKLYIEPLCDSCTLDLIGAGWDLTLTPKSVTNHATQTQSWPNYPVLKGLPT